MRAFCGAQRMGYFSSIWQGPNVSEIRDILSLYLNVVRHYLHQIVEYIYIIYYHGGLVRAYVRVYIVSFQLLCDSFI